MSNDRLTNLEQRLALAEHEVRTTRAQVRELQQQAQRRMHRGRRDGLLGLVALVLVFSVAQALQTEAQGSGQTVRAPFTVVDAANKPIFSVIDGAHRGVEMKRSDGKAFVQLWDEGASIRGPLAVTDNAEKAIAIVQDSSVTTVKDAKGVEQAVTSNRGLHVFNPKGDVVARVAVIEEDGYVSARKGGQGTSVGGIQGVLSVDQGYSFLGLAGTAAKFNVRLKSDVSGLQFRDDAGIVLSEINRTHMWFGDGAGNGVVEAGMLPDKRGVVRVGPRMGGPQGPGQLGFPYQIVGRK
jgi:hypothetical protein